MYRFRELKGRFYARTRQVVVVAVFTILLMTDEAISAFYTNQIAVHIDGGPQVAHSVAKRHGFVNLGQIGTLEDRYLFEHPRIARRSLSPSHEHHSKLNQESEVRWFEQQVVLKRSKRDLIDVPYTMTDPTWKDQWYLQRDQHLDMNVVPAWRKGYTGKGVVITILDDGIEKNHSDLVANYDPQASYDINGKDADPMPRYDVTNENRHGTRCAGEVSAMANNSICGVGVAFGSSIGGVRMLDGQVTDAVEAASLSLNPGHIDIYSASWGPDDDGRVVDGPGTLAKASFINGVTKGRGGLGSIFVWASGNGGNSHDSCNCDGYTNSIFTLSISSTSEKGTKPWYLEECSSTLAATYSSGGYREKQIVTTDLRNQCTKSHTGTSAAAPLAAGIVALVLEANPKLSWRDVQYITMLTARTQPFVDANWVNNSMGRLVSLRYGYGLMDTSAMVKLAETWKTVPQQHTCEKTAETGSVPLSKSTYSAVVMTDGCAGTNTEIRFLEHVQINLTLSYSRRGDVSLHLTSPRGTTSTLLLRRLNDRSSEAFNNWPFMSVHFWGEDPHGTWRLEIRNEGVASNHGMLESWTLRLHGTATDPLTSRSTTTTPIATTHTATQQICDEECLDSCSGPLPENCDRCRHVLMASSRKCIKECPAAFFIKNQTCLPCDATCESCSGPLGTQCTSCFGGWYNNTENNTCVMNCQDGYYEEHPSRKCSRCDKNCRTCNQKADQCTGCDGDRKLESGICVECRKNEYKNQRGVCEECHITCASCKGPSIFDCLSCVSDGSLVTYLQNNKCVLQCDDQFYLAAATPPSTSQSCEMCHVTCATCSGPSMHDCLSCASAGSLVIHLLNGACVSKCDLNFYLSAMTQPPKCKSCHPACKTCVGAGPRDCASCEDGFKLFGREQGECQLAAPYMCPVGQFMGSHQCLSCDPSCQTCGDFTKTSCLSCPPNSVLFERQCMKECGEGFYPVQQDVKGREVQLCAKCSQNCVGCHGATEADCHKCKPPLMLINGACRTLDCQDEEYYDLVHGRCTMCDNSCAKCKGPSHNDCLACDHAYLLTGQCLSSCPEGYYPTTDRLCAVCSPGDTRCVKEGSPNTNQESSSRPNPEGRPSDSRIISSTIAMIIMICLVPVVIAVVVFALLQVRSNQLLCWRHNYSKVPLTFDPMEEKLPSSTTIGMDYSGDEVGDEDEELFINSKPNGYPNNNVSLENHN